MRFARALITVGIAVTAVAGAAVSVLPAAATPAAPSAASAFRDLDDFGVISFDADYTLARDAADHAALTVVETIVADFPSYDQNRGLIRDIPEYYGDVRLHTAVQSVVDENGDPVPYDTEYYLDAFSVLLGDDSFVHGRTTYVITYTQVDTIRTTFTDRSIDEFYWDVNGTAWAQSIGRVSATVRVESALVPALTGEAACYQGPDLSSDPCRGGITGQSADDGSTVFQASASDLAANEGLTVAIGFASGTFVEGAYDPPPTNGSGDGPEYDPVPEVQLPWFLRFGSVVLGPLVLLIGFIASATQGNRAGGATRASDIVVPQYQPPEGLDIMVAAHLVGRPKTAYPAQIVALAVAKKIRMLDHPADLDRAPYGVELLDGSGLTPNEQAVVDALFGAGAVVGTRRALVPDDASLGRAFGPVGKRVEAELKTRGYRDAPRPTVLWGVLLGLALLLGAATVIAMIGAANAGGEPELGFFGLIGAAWGLFLVLGRVSTVAPLSDRGKALNDQLLGLKMYLELAEEDRLRMLQSPEGAERVSVPRIDPADRTQMLKLYEDLLPWAIVWGVEDRWSEVIRITAEQARVPVSWITSDDQLSSWQIRSTINGIGRAVPDPPRAVVARAMNSSSGSSFWGGGGGGGSSWSGGGGSFSSGSGGGGFSGGGGGGGGGRGR